ncbi:MAG: glycosyltransferase [Syntrophobacter sp.]
MFFRALIIVHFASMAGLALYGLHRLWMLVCWHIERGKPAPAHSPQPIAPADLPHVTVQLPLYNERFVAARLMDAVAQLDWPRDRFEIQVLDDSTDDTRHIVDERAEHWRGKGIDIRVIRRENRKGYKAGALENGLSLAKGDFIAVFDADFVPSKDFLPSIIPCFADPRIGMAQARWDFLNSNHSWISNIQSLLLGPHFSIEHLVRFRRGLFFNFNGTAGVWRKKAIFSSGGWQHDTVTEDLDLSYRAQLAGWRFVYLDDVTVPSELPVTLAAFRSQQQRWAKGSIQTARKILPRLLLSPLPLSVKLESVAHLLSNLGWFLCALLALTIYPTIQWRVDIGPYQLLRLDVPLILCTSVAMIIYFSSYALNRKSSAGSFLPLLLLPVLSIGMAPYIALSVLNGALRHGGIFVRTPKFGICGSDRLPSLAFIYQQRELMYLALSAALFAYSLLPLHFAWQRETWLALPFLGMFPLGFFIVLAIEFIEVVKQLVPGTQEPA